MSKKWSQYDPFTALAGDEEIVGLQGGTNKRGAVNGVFKTFFDASYWPLGGAADLASNFFLDGNGFDMFCGSTSPFGIVEIYSTSSVQLASTDVGLGLSASISVGPDNAIIQSSDGVTMSSLDFSANHFHVDMVDAHIHSDGTSILLSMDDGVDSSTLSLTPLGLSFDFLEGGTTEFNGNWTLDGGAGVDLRFGIGFGINRFSDFQIGVIDNFAVNVNAVAVFTATEESFSFSGAPIELPTYTVATLPSSPPPRLLVFCSDESGGEVPVFSDNSGNWRRVTDGNIAA